MVRRISLAAAAFFALLAAALLLSVSGCGRSSDRPVSTLTEHQRDSVLAKSALPGAAVVGRALDESAAQSNRAANLDSLTQSQ